MDIDQLEYVLVGMGFVPTDRVDVYPAQELTHPAVEGSSVFVGDWPPRYVGPPGAQTQQHVPYLIANGRSRAEGMAKRLRALVPPTGTLAEPHQQPSADDDAYWEGDALLELVYAMAGVFRPT